MPFIEGAWSPLYPATDYTAQHSVHGHKRVLWRTLCLPLRCSHLWEARLFNLTARALGQEIQITASEWSCKVRSGEIAWGYCSWKFAKILKSTMGSLITTNNQGLCFMSVLKDRPMFPYLFYLGPGKEGFKPFLAVPGYCLEISQPNTEATHPCLSYAIRWVPWNRLWTPRMKTERVSPFQH